MLEQIRSELKAIRAAEAARQQAIADRETELSNAELIVGGLLIVTSILGMAAFISIWTKLSSRNLMMLLKDSTRYSSMEQMGRASTGTHELPVFPGGLAETPSPIVKNGMTTSTTMTSGTVDSPQVTVVDDPERI